MDYSTHNHMVYLLDLSQKHFWIQHRQSGISPPTRVRRGIKIDLKSMLVTCKYFNSTRSVKLEVTRQDLNLVTGQKSFVFIMSAKPPTVSLYFKWKLSNL